MSTASTAPVPAKAPRTKSTTTSAASASAAPKRPRAPKPTPVPEATAAEPAPTADPIPTPTDADGESTTPADDAATGSSAKVTAEDVVGVINASTATLRNEVVNAKARKDKDGAAAIMTVIKQLNGIRKHIDRLARSKPQRKKVAVDAAKNGLLKPVKISKELATFLGCDENELRSRVQVTQAICAYIREHKLQNPENNLEVILDKTLVDLLNVNYLGENPKVLYSDIQVFVKMHYQNASPEEPVTRAPQ